MIYWTTWKRSIVTDLTSVDFLYHLAQDRTAYETGKFLISEGFVPHVVKPPVRWTLGLVSRWIMVRNGTRVPLTSTFYPDTLGRRRRGRKTSHTRTSQGE